MINEPGKGDSSYDVVSFDAVLRKCSRKEKPEGFLKRKKERVLWQVCISNNTLQKLILGERLEVERLFGSRNIEDEIGASLV
jgi:hypothetical protein